MKKIFNNKKVYIGLIVITLLIYIFLIYGGIQKGITLKEELLYRHSIKGTTFFDSLPVEVPVYDRTIIFIYNILIMIFCIVINILSIIFNNKRKLKKFMLALFIVLSLTVVPICIKTRYDGYIDMGMYKYNSCIIHTDSYSKKWPIIGNLFN